MEIIDKVSRSLGLSNKDEEKEIEMSTPEELHIPQTEQQDQPVQPPPASPAGHNVIDFNSVARDNLMANNNSNINGNINSMMKSKITTIRPKNFDDDAKIIADYLRDNIPVIINLEETNPEHARRIIDFALGTTYAIEGDVQRVGESVFVCTPKTVMVTFNREEQKPEHDFSWLTRKL